MAEFSDSGVLQATNALIFVQAQLMELAMDCDYTVQNGLVSLQYVVQLQNNLEKLLHEVGVFSSKLILRNTHIPLFIVHTFCI